MIEIIFLGTGSMQPTKTRNHSAIMLSYKNENILFDCGEGTQRQIRVAGIKPAKITKIFISHWHGDHTLGLGGLLSTIGADRSTENGKIIQIYGPTGTKEYFKHLLLSFAKKDLVEHQIIEVKEGVIFENDDFKMEAVELNHSVPCIGYSFIEKERRRIKVSKMEKLGLSGPILGELQKGNDVVVKGKKIKAEEMTYAVEKKKISYIADTSVCGGASKLAENADLLISEGTHLDDIKEKTAKYKHLTVKEAALIASENNAKRLVITHISKRYKGPSEVLEEAKIYFENSSVAEDFMKIRI